MSAITEAIAGHIRMTKPLTDEQCVSALSDDFTAADVRSELQACRTLIDNGFTHSPIVYDKAENRWELRPRVGEPRATTTHKEKRT